jgi:hypothetical protein
MTRIDWAYKYHARWMCRLENEQHAEKETQQHFPRKKSRMPQKNRAAGSVDDNDRMTILLSLIINIMLVS